MKTKEHTSLDILTVVAALKDVSFHLEIAVFGAEMDLGGQHHLNIGLLLRELTWWSGSCGRHGLDTTQRERERESLRISELKTPPPLRTSVSVMKATRV